MSPLRTRSIRPRALAAAGAVAMIVTAGCGGHGDTAAGNAAIDATPDRTVAISMVDNRFVPDSVAVTAGETIEFRFTNDGAVDHEAFVGPASEQQDHGMAMSSGDEHAAHHASAVEVPVGAAKSLTYTFDDARPLQIGCHEPGHFEAGMVADIKVA